MHSKQDMTLHLFKMKTSSSKNAHNWDLVVLLHQPFRRNSPVVARNWDFPVMLMMTWGMVGGQSCHHALGKAFFYLSHTAQESSADVGYFLCSLTTELGGKFPQGFVKIFSKSHPGPACCRASEACPTCSTVWFLLVKRLAWTGRRLRLKRAFFLSLARLHVQASKC